MPFFHVRIEVGGTPKQFLLKTKSQVAEALQAIAASGVASIPVQKSPEVDAYAAEENDWAWSTDAGMRLYNQKADQPWIQRKRETR